MTASQTETHAGPAIAVDVKKNVRSAFLYFQIKNRRPTSSGDFFCGCFSACANDIRGIWHDNFFLYEGQLSGSFEICAVNHLLVFFQVGWDKDRHFHRSNRRGGFRTKTESAEQDGKRTHDCDQGVFHILLLGGLTRKR